MDSRVDHDPAAGDLERLDAVEARPRFQILDDPARPLIQPWKPLSLARHALSVPCFRALPAGGLPPALFSLAR
jgi:hypothetical protein